MRERLARYVVEYNEAVWPDLSVPIPTADDLELMELRVDGWANAHVTSGHTCPWDAEECGERNAAAEYVESF
jgi:hypothetical protein